MANLSETSVWETGVYQIETTDPVLGGPPNPETGAGMSNIPHLQLARRTLFLKGQVDSLLASIATINGQITALGQAQRIIPPVLVATTANITLSELQTIDGVSVTAGRRVLVKNQSTPAQNGVYVAGAGAWARATDLDDNADVVPGMIVGVTAGTTQADTLWILSSPDEGVAITVGSTALSFANVTALSAPLASPALTGAPTAPTPAQFNDSTLLATTAFVQRALGNYQSATTFSGNLTLTAADAGECFVYGETVAATITLPTIAATAIGSTFEFINTGTADLTVQRAGPDLIDSGPTSGTSIVIPPNQSLKLVRASASSLWHPVGITAAALAQPMAASLAGNGWQRLPSGLIIQWGSLLTSATNGANSVWTFPIAFPAACALAFGAYGPTSSPFTDVTTPLFTVAKSNSQATFRSYSGNDNGIDVFAIGW